MQAQVWEDKNDERHQRLWGVDPINATPKNFQSYFLLVRAPLTFGHSQLVLRRTKGESEAVTFEKASKQITTAMRTFESSLDSELLKSYPKLAAFTQTSGKFERTLVLRASADEDENSYKVHLVPYFESHASLCALRYMHTNARHGGKLDGKFRMQPNRGGLLGWLGDREAVCDTLETGIAMTEGWATKGVKSEAWYKDTVIASFQLTELATYFQGKRDALR